MKVRNIFITICLICTLVLGGSIFASTHYLTVTEMTYTTDKIKNEIRLVILADLHEHQFGNNNETLLKKVHEQFPDLILLDGDLINKDCQDTAPMLQLLTDLQTIAPVYCAWGNHELDYAGEQKAELEQQIEDTGAVLLDKEYEDIVIKENTIRLGGMFDYAFGFTKGENVAEDAPQEVNTYLQTFQQTNALKIMLSHRPDSFIFGNASTYWDIDLVIAAHNHGGQVRIPILGGMYGGDQGWFPDYIDGIKPCGNMTICSTRGLGTNKKILPRINNTPEILLLTIK